MTNKLHWLSICFQIAILRFILIVTVGFVCFILQTNSKWNSIQVKWSCPNLSPYLSVWLPQHSEPFGAVYVMDSSLITILVLCVIFLWQVITHNTKVWRLTSIGNRRRALDLSFFNKVMTINLRSDESSSEHNWMPIPFLNNFMQSQTRLNTGTVACS